MSAAIIQKRLPGNRIRPQVCPLELERASESWGGFISTDRGPHAQGLIQEAQGRAQERAFLASSDAAATGPETIYF